jgi:hypothetical protein
VCAKSDARSRKKKSADFEKRSTLQIQRPSVMLALPATYDWVPPCVCSISCGISSPPSPRRDPQSSVISTHLVLTKAGGVVSLSLMMKTSQSPEARDVRGKVTDELVSAEFV